MYVSVVMIYITVRANFEIKTDLKSWRWLFASSIEGGRRQRVVYMISSTIVTRLCRGMWEIK